MPRLFTQGQLLYRQATDSRIGHETRLKRKYGNRIQATCSTHATCRIHMLHAEYMLHAEVLVAGLQIQNIPTAFDHVLMPSAGRTDRSKTSYPERCRQRSQPHIENRYNASEARVPRRKQPKRRVNSRAQIHTASEILNEDAFSCQPRQEIIRLSQLNTCCRRPAALF